MNRRHILAACRPDRTIISQPAARSPAAGNLAPGCVAAPFDPSKSFHSKSIVLTEDHIARFWAKVDRRSDDECWEWTAHIDNHGYGTFAAANKMALSHRVAFLIGHGVDPKGFCVCHKCDNRRCCNPAHLWLGTQRDNVIDGIQKGRITQIKFGHDACAAGHERSEENTRITPRGTKACRVCERIWKTRGAERRAQATREEI